MQRGGVGYPVGEQCLVDIEADATDGGGDSSALYFAGGECAADFVSVDKNVVGPFDMTAVCRQQNCQQIADAQGDNLCDAEIVGSIQKAGVEQQAAGDVCIGLALPAIAALAYAGGLRVGPNDSELLDFR